MIDDQKSRPKKPGFMAQIDKARRDIKRMPKWMRESMRWATATFPTIKKDHEIDGITPADAKEGE